MNSIIFGTGEYVTGWTGASGSKSDKSLGVVALVHFDLRERGLIGDKIALCGTNGGKFDDIRKHFKEKIKFTNLPNLEFDQFPKVSFKYHFDFFSSIIYSEMLMKQKHNCFINFDRRKL